MARPFWTPDALESLEALAEYLDRTSPGHATHYLSRLLSATDVLDEFPLIGRSVPEFDASHFRELIIQNHRIIYRIVDGRPWILLVIHGAVDLRSEMSRRGLD